MSIYNNKILKNASWIIICRIVQSFISLFIGMITARYLGPGNYGLINYAGSLVAFMVPIAQLGLKNVLVEEIVSNPQDEGEIVGTALIMSISASILSMIGILTFVYCVNTDETETLIVCALYGVSLVFQMTEMIQYWYQAKLLSKYTSVVSLCAYVIVSVYKIYLLVNAKSIYWFAISNALDYFVISITLLIIYRRLGANPLSFSLEKAKMMFAKSKYYIVSSMMVSIFAQTDKIMLKTMIDDVTNGYYTAAVSCAGITAFVFAAIIDSYRPVIYVSRSRSIEDYEMNLKRLYSVIIYMGIIQSLGFTVFAKIIIYILFGQQYMGAVNILKIITWYSAFSYMGTIRNIWMLAEKKQQYLWVINLSGAVLNVIGNLILIPKMGACGAAMASVITQIVTNFVLCFIIRPIKQNGILILRALDIRILIDMIKSLKI